MNESYLAASVGKLPVDAGNVSVDPGNVSVDAGNAATKISEHIYSDSERMVLVVYLGAVVIPVAVIMNSLLILAFFKYKKLRITGMYFILNLAVNNLIATTISAPIIISSIMKVNPGAGILEAGFACDLRALLDAVLLCASAVTLAVSSVDRCLAVCRPFTYHKLMTYGRALWIIVGIWVVCLLVALPPINFKFTSDYKSWGYYKFSRYTYSCGVSVGQSSYPLFYFIFTLFIPVVVAILSYSAIFSVAAKSIRHMGKTYRNVEQVDFKTRNRTMKSALRTLALVGVFAITFLPILVISCIVWVQMQTANTPLHLSRTVTKILVWVVYSSYALNPIVYGLMDRNFRGAYKTFIKCNIYHDEFRQRAQKQLYNDLEDDRRRSIAVSQNRYSISQSGRCRGEYGSGCTDSLDRTQSIALAEIRSNGTTPRSASLTLNRSPSTYRAGAASPALNGDRNHAPNGDKVSLDTYTKSSS